MSNVSHRVQLECTTGGSNKFYTLWLLEVNDGFVVQGHYGPIGAAGVDRAITPPDKPMAEWQAIDKLEAFAAKKISQGGYVRTSSSGSGDDMAPEYNFRILGGGRRAAGMFTALAKKNATVAEAVAALNRCAAGNGWRPLLSVDLPEFPLVLALCRAGKAELRFGTEPCNQTRQMALIAEISCTREGYAMLVAIGLMADPKMDFAAAIGIEAVGLAL